MKQRRLNEVLEECLAACLEGRRTVEESLSLYPSLSDHLEPLLRTALSVADSFQDYTPPPYVRERGLQRFLASARTRARALTRDMGMRPARASWGLRQWGFLGSGIAAAVGLVLITGLVMSNGSGGDGGFVFNNQTPVATASRSSTVAPVVRNFTEHVDTISAKLSQGQHVAAEDIATLTQIVSQIDPSTLDQASQSELANSVPNAIAALQTIDGNQSSPEVREALSAANLLKGKLVPEFSPGPTVGPGPSGEPTETPAATPTFAPTATQAPATAPTPNDQSPATPGPTTDARGVDTFSQPLNINPLAIPAKEP